MSTERETTRIVRSWLETGVTALPERVLDAVLDQLPATPQRRSRWPAWRFAPMNLYSRIGLAAVTILAVVVVGYELLPLHGELGASPSPSASPGMSPIVGPLTSVPSPSGLPALGLPGTRANTVTGEYGWDGLLGSKTGMHNVVYDGSNLTTAHMTQLVFTVEDACFQRDDVHAPVHRAVAGLDAMYLEPYTGPPMLFMPAPEVGQTTEAYALPISDRTLCVYLTWDAATTPAELDAARQVVQSIHGEPLGPTGIRIVFTLGPGWDNG